MSGTVVAIRSRRARRRPEPPFARLSKVLTEPDLPLKANERLVALVMFQHISLKTMKCWPSMDTITRRAKVSRHTVIRTIRVLQEVGLLKVKKRRVNGRFERNEYDFSAIKTRRDHVSR